MASRWVQYSPNPKGRQQTACGRALGKGLVLLGEGICAEDVWVGDCVAEGREEGVEAFDILREGADDE